MNNFEIVTYKFNNEIDSQYYDWLFSHLPKSRKEKVEKKASAVDKQLCLMEYYIIKEKLNLIDNPDYEYNENGKPFLKGQKHFSISHSGDTLAIAISDDEIGIDIQQTIIYKEKLAKFICNENELEQLYCAQDKNQELTSLWIKKESLVKLLGQTIFTDIKSIDTLAPNYEFSLSKLDDYQICVCQRKRK